jgi:hypothetical protein
MLGIRVVKSLITASCISGDFEKQIVRRCSRLIGSDNQAVQLTLDDLSDNGQGELARSRS